MAPSDSLQSSPDYFVASCIVATYNEAVEWLMADAVVWLLGKCRCYQHILLGMLANHPDVARPPLRPVLPLLLLLPLPLLVSLPTSDQQAARVGTCTPCSCRERRKLFCDKLDPPHRPVMQRLSCRRRLLPLNFAHSHAGLSQSVC